MPAPQAAGGLVRQARRDARAHHRAWLLPCHARLCSRWHGHRTSAGERARNLSGEQAADHSSLATRREQVGDRADLAQGRRLTEYSSVATGAERRPSRFTPRAIVEKIFGG